MAIKYIATTGSDTTGDGSSGNPYLTISKGVSVASSGDTIEVGPGTYNEKISYASKTLTFDAAGAVILDGSTGSLTTPALSVTSSGTAITTTMKKKTGTSGSWTIQNYLGTSLILFGGAVNQVIDFANTTLTSSGNSYGINYVSVGGGSTITAFANCTFTGFTSAALYVSPTIPSLTSCTFTNNNVAIQWSGNMAITTCSGNTFTSCNYATYSNAAGIGGLFSNNTYTNTRGWYYGAEKTVTLWKALNANCDNSGSTFTSVWDGVVYVNKSGNDSNAYPYSKDTAKLTLQSGVSFGTTNTSIVSVGSGSYNEKITFPGRRTMYADGVVEIDGTGLASGALINNTTDPANTFDAAPTGGLWIFKNNSGTYIYQYTYASTATITFKNCVFLSNSNQYGIYFGGNFAIVLTIQNCIFSGFTTAGIFQNNSNSNGTAALYNNDFYNCTIGYSVLNFAAAANSFLNINNIYSNCTTAYKFASQGVSNVTQTSRNNMYYSITNWIETTTTYTSLTGLQAAGFDLGSVVEQPMFEDATNNVFFLKTASSLSRSQGAIPFGYATGSAASDAKWIITATANNTGWYNADGNVTKNGTTGFFELTAGTSGTIVSPIIDLGTVQAIRGLNLGVDQTWGTSMVDYDKTDVKPNYQTIRVRASGTTFAQDAASPSWTEVKTEQPISVITGRYVQIELILRSDDVAA